MTQEPLTLTQYLRQMIDGTEESELPRSLVYRGQAHADWQLHSAAARRIIAPASTIREDSVAEFEQSLIEYQNDLVANFRNRRFDTRDGAPLSDLEILAVLQHLGAATALIDFTRNPFVALWFACEHESNDGVVYKVDAVSNQYIGVHSESRSTFGEILAQLVPPLHLLAWSPPAMADAQERTVAQQSVLLLGKPRTPAELSVPKDRVLGKVLIPKASKAQLRAELAAIGMDESALFPDIYGFAGINSVTHPLGTNNALAMLKNASRAHIEGDYETAIELYTKYLQERPRDTFARLCLSNVYVDNQVYSHALEILDAVGELLEQSSAINRHAFYYNRANVQAALHKHDEAIIDYTQALAQGIDFNTYVWFNRGNSNFAIGNYSAALADYENCSEFANAAYNAANAHIALGQMERALESFVTVSNMSNAPIEWQHNEEAIQHVVALLDAAEYTCQLTDTMLEISIEEARELGPHTMFGLAGNIGNQGNTGWITSPGGQGFDGTRGMVIAVSANDRS